MNDEIPMKDLFPLKLERCLRNIIFLGNCNKYIAFIDDTEDGILFEPSEEKVIVKGYCNEHTRPPFEVKTIKKIAFILLQNSRVPSLKDLEQKIIETPLFENKILSIKNFIFPNDTSDKNQDVHLPRVFCDVDLMHDIELVYYNSDIIKNYYGTQDQRASQTIKDIGNKIHINYAMNLNTEMYFKDIEKSITILIENFYNHYYCKINPDLLNETNIDIHSSNILLLKQPFINEIETILLNSIYDSQSECCIGGLLEKI